MRRPDCSTCLGARAGIRCPPFIAAHTLPGLTANRRPLLPSRSAIGSPFFPPNPERGSIVDKRVRSASLVPEQGLRNDQQGLDISGIQRLLLEKLDHWKQSLLAGPGRFTHPAQN